MDVLFYLKELLNSRKTISIVGLGTLYKKKSPGKYDENSRSFIAPSYTLTFNNEVNDTETLIHLIAQEEKIDVESARLEIKNFTEKILAQLAKQKEFALAGLGKFILTNNEIVFSTDDNNDIANEFYGFPNINEITESTQKTNDINEEDVNLIAQEKADTKIELENITTENKPKFTGKPFTPNFDYYDDEDAGREMSKPLKILLKILSIIAIIVSIIGLAYFFKPEFFDGKILNDNSDNFEAQTVIVTPKDSLSKEDSLINLDTSKILNLDTNVAVKSIPETIANNVITYEVIGSAEKTQKRIDLVINRMKKRGIEAKALENVQGKLIKISLGSFTNLTLAKKYKDSLRKKLNNSEIYIQTIKPKK